MSGGITTGLTESGPWAAQADPLKKGFARAEGLYQAGPAPYYPKDTLAGFDPAQKAAQAEILGYVGGKRPGVQQALAEKQMGRTYDWAAKMPETVATGMEAVGPNLQSMMGGAVDYKTGPFNKMAEAYKKQVESQLTGTGGALANIRSGLVNYQPGGSSRGNVLQQEAIVKAVNEGLAMPLAQQYGQAYQQGQAGRLPAAQAIQQGYGNISNAYGQAAQTGLAGMQQYPSLMAAPLSMMGAKADVGAQRRAMAQEDINQKMQAYEYGVNAPQTTLQNYMAGISGEYGGTQRARPSALQSAGQLGSLMSGLGMIGG